jgi:LacI family transcriptional regulator
MVTEHFLERGFRHFAVYGMSTEAYFEERCRNYVEAVSKAGFEWSVFDQGHRGEQPLDWERQQLELADWVASLPKPIGVLTCTDQLGFWFLDACRRAGAAVPEEVAVVSCENDESLTTMATPPLSSVQFHAERTGYEAAALLDRLMKGEAPPAEPTLIPPLEIVVRQSSDIVAVEDKEVAAALQFIREHASQGIGVEEVLRAIPVSRVSLDHRMRRAIGRTIKAQIVQVQLEVVKRFLAETDLALSQIAQRSGFRHPQYMAELFKKRFGVTPGTYRSEVHER